jgi:hypothetical protein
MYETDGVGLALESGGWQSSVPVEKDGERGRSAVEGRRWCGVLRGSNLAFYRAGREAPGRRWPE